MSDSSTGPCRQILWSSGVWGWSLFSHFSPQNAGDTSETSIRHFHASGFDISRNPPMETVQEVTWKWMYCIWLHMNSKMLLTPAQCSHCLWRNGRHMIFKYDSNYVLRMCFSIIHNRNMCAGKDDVSLAMNIRACKEQNKLPNHKLAINLMKASQPFCIILEKRKRGCWYRARFKQML